MAKYNNSVLTTAGLALANRAAKGVTKFKITKVTSTADVVADSTITALTKLPNEVQVGTITGEQPLPDGDGTITGTKVLFVNHKLQTSYRINAVGLYAVEEGGPEFLYAVITAVEPEFMPDFSDQVLMEFGMTIYIVVGQVESMSIVVAPESFATVAYVDKAIADHQVVFPKTLTYSDKNEVITGTWQFKNGAVDGEGNAIATAKDVSDGDAEALTSAKDYADTKISGKADDSKVVHTADMRKPASDVVGLEDVPQAVVHSALASGVDLNTVVTPGVYPFAGVHLTNYIDNATYWGYVVVTSGGGIVTQKVHTIGSILPLYRMQSGPTMSWSRWVGTADDGRVAHLYGSNNFDTTPTVNNNPLLLASSLPSDLARLSQDANFTAKLQQNGQDVALANNTIARNPNTGVVSEPVDFTKLTVNGGKSVATSDDLKSVEESAWRELDLSGTSGIYTGKILIKIDQVNKYVYFMMNAQIPRNACSQGTKIIDLSNVVTGLSSAHGYLQGWLDDREMPYNIQGSTITVSGACLTIGEGYSGSGASRIATEADPNKQYCYAVYDDLVNN
ncbi:hypothetical protein [Levilactobacillus namurensis]|uniref:hypothetical protein n=1 Tax=Levilactobacillus namurensis TaxID=380393 RepID=UPI0004633C19|nr:hypothetical protein [Levilactobacillus namurensis]